VSRFLERTAIPIVELSTVGFGIMGIEEIIIIINSLLMYLQDITIISK
jgi:hypothetical protein